MNLDFDNIPDLPRKSALRVRYFSDEVRIRKMSWSAGSVANIAFIICSFWILSGFWSLLTFAVARNGPNLAQLGPAVLDTLVRLSIPGAVVGLIAVYQVVRWISTRETYWELILQEDQWRLQGLFGMRTYGSVLPDYVRNLFVSSNGQVMADLASGWEPVSGPQKPQDAGWLRDALALLIGKPDSAVSSPVAKEAAAVLGTPPRPAAEIPNWPGPPAATANDIVPPSYVHSLPGTHLQFRLQQPPRGQKFRHYLFDRLHARFPLHALSGTGNGVR